MFDLYSFPFSAMGTECNLHFYASNPSVAQEIADHAIDEVYRIEDRYSRYNPHSLLSQINQAAQSGGSVCVDDETAGLLDYAYACYESSERLFDITSGVLRNVWDFSSGIVPEQEQIKSLLPRIGLDKISWNAPNLEFTVPGMELDFGGIGKEYAADRVSEILVSRGIAHGLVDLGGDINVIGPHPDHAPWVIEIRHPRQTDSSVGTVEIHRGALASSGDYERCVMVNGVRYSHIINPLTGWPVRGLACVSVIAEKCVVAGSLCTIAMLKGFGGVNWLEDIGAAHFWVNENGDQGGSLKLNYRQRI
ncbi:MAG: FAD:protein FMN transferase [Nitrospinae bacterium]|nr:FAD:protein FMN transferase [Nitrospinota bacterium]MBF0633485.1 FAD:protein FMN transferase [Nitrospinota bacterium]